MKIELEIIKETPAEDTEYKIKTLHNLGRLSFEGDKKVSCLVEGIIQYIESSGFRVD